MGNSPVIDEGKIREIIKKARTEWRKEEDLIMDQIVKNHFMKFQPQVTDIKKTLDSTVKDLVTVK